MEPASKVFLMMMMMSCAAAELAEADTTNQPRAKKKHGIRMWGILLFLVASKLIVSKLVSGLFLWGLFQKFCYLIGIMMGVSRPGGPGERPPEYQAEYRPEYDTVGFSQAAGHAYGAPEAPPALQSVPPNWPYQKRSLEA